MTLIGKVRGVLKRVFNPSPEAKRYRQLIDAVQETRAKNILEIGTYFAVRSKQMINAAKKFRATHEISFYGFDLFENLTEQQFKEEISKKSPPLSWVREELEKTGTNIHLFPGDTRVSLSEAVPSLPEMDVVFIDGGHSIETIESDWKNVEKVLKKGSVVIFDDYWPDRTDAGAKPIVDAIDRERYDVTILPIVDVFDNPNHGRLTIQFARVVKK